MAQAAIIRRIELVVMLTLTLLDEKRPYLLFTHPRAGKQQSGHGENEFGGDCMLGKLCGLAKQCGQKLAADQLDHDRRSRLCNSKTQDEGVC